MSQIIIFLLHVDPERQTMGWSADTDTISIMLVTPWCHLHANISQIITYIFFITC